MFLKGISLEFMLFLKPICPFLRTNLYLIRHAKGDRPNQATMFRNLTGIKQLDMMDTRRFQIINKWKIYKKAPDPSTAGQFFKQGTVAGNTFASDMKEGLTVAKVDPANAMTGPD